MLYDFRIDERNGVKYFEVACFPKRTRRDGKIKSEVVQSARVQEIAQRFWDSKLYFHSCVGFRKSVEFSFTTEPIYQQLRPMKDADQENFVDEVRNLLKKINFYSCCAELSKLPRLRLEKIQEELINFQDENTEVLEND